MYIMPNGYYRSPLTGQMTKCQPMSQICEEAGITPETMANYCKNNGNPERDVAYWLVQEPFIQKIDVPHSFVTISLPKELYMNDFSEKVKRIIDNNTGAKCFGDREIKFCLEFYGKELEMHPHVHLLIKGNGMDKAKIIRAFSRGFDIKPNFIDYKAGKKHDLHQKRVNYINGDKVERKLKQIEADEKFRVKNNINKIYYININAEEPELQTPPPQE